MIEDYVALKIWHHVLMWKNIHNILNEIKSKKRLQISIYRIITFITISFMQE